MKQYTIIPSSLNLNDIDTMDLFVSERKIADIFRNQEISSKFNSPNFRVKQILKSSDFENYFDEAKKLVASTNGSDDENRTYSVAIFDMYTNGSKVGLNLIHGFKDGKELSLDDLFFFNRFSKDILIINPLKDLESAKDLLFYAALTAKPVKGVFPPKFERNYSKVFL